MATIRLNKFALSRKLNNSNQIPRDAEIIAIKVFRNGDLLVEFSEFNAGGWVIKEERIKHENIYDSSREVSGRTRDIRKY